MSEWNEQVFYARLFFNETALCRMAQGNSDIFAWKRHLEGKMSLGASIIDEKEVGKIKEIYIYLNNKFISILGEDGKNREAYSKLVPILFYTEIEIDRMVNKKMPFLKLKPKIDLKGL